MFSQAELPFNTAVTLSTLLFTNARSRSTHITRALPDAVGICPCTHSEHCYVHQCIQVNACNQSTAMMLFFMLVCPTSKPSIWIMQ